MRMLSASLAMSLAALLAAAPARSQNAPAPASPQGAARPGFVLQPLTAEQLYARTASQLDAGNIAAIAYAKSKGESAAGYAEHVARLFGPSWGQPNTGRPIAFFRSMYLNWRIWPATVVEPVTVTDTLVVARVKRGWAASFGAEGQRYGVTAAEYDTVTSVITRRLVERLGMRYTDRIDGDWMIVTVSGAGAAAAPAEFPVGTYTATIAQLPERQDLVGSWTIVFDRGGQVTASFNGEEIYRATYETSLDQIVIGADSGQGACNAPGATYRWVRGSQRTVTFVRLTESCDARRLVLSRTFAPMP